MGDEGFEPSSQTAEKLNTETKAAQNQAHPLHGSQSSDTSEVDIALDEFCTRLGLSASVRQSIKAIVEADRVKR